MDRQLSRRLRTKLRRLLTLEEPLSPERRRAEGPAEGPRTGEGERTPAVTLGFSAIALTVGLLASGAVAAGDHEKARLEDRVTQAKDEVRRLRGELALQELEVQRLRAIQERSAEYGIPADLATRIHDTALAEGLSPDLAFRLVHVESSFRKRAVSHKGAVGYTQIKPSTARWMEPGVSERDLFDTDTNLRLGFRYLRMLLDRYEGDLRLALLAYNQGPGRVGKLLAMGQDPANGYARSVMGGVE